MTPADMPAFDPYLIALLDGNMLTFAFLSMTAAGVAKALAVISPNNESGKIGEWAQRLRIVSAVFGALSSFRKNHSTNGGQGNGKKEADPQP